MPMTVSGHPDAVANWDRQAEDWVNGFVVAFYEPFWQITSNPQSATIGAVHSPSEAEDRFQQSVAERYATLLLEDRYILDVNAFIKEVDNGGIDQFFTNSCGDHTRETLQALQAIGAIETASVLKKAMSLFPNGEPFRSRPHRQHELRRIRIQYAATIDNLDHEFGYRHEDLYALLRCNWTRAKINASG
jgi:hypothetical protein